MGKEKSRHNLPEIKQPKVSTKKLSKKLDLTEVENEVNPNGKEDFEYLLKKMIEQADNKPKR